MYKFCGISVYEPDLSGRAYTAVRRRAGAEMSVADDIRRRELPTVEQVEA